MINALKIEGIEPRDLIVGAIHRGKITQRLTDDKQVSELAAISKLQFMVWHVPKQTAQDIAVELNFFQNVECRAEEV